MLTLLANVGPPLHPQPTAPVDEWITWGVYVGLAAVLGGWAILKKNRSPRDKFVGVALLSVVALVVCAALLTVWKSREQ